MTKGKRKIKTYLSAIIACLVGGISFLVACFAPADKMSYPEGAEIPRLQNNRKEQIINHDGFTLSYNADFKIANWVAYELTADEVRSNEVGRTNQFFPDPKVKGATATDRDYRRSGYDRGHLVPAGDMRWSVEGMQASFYFSNICPQNRDLNAGLWNDLEKQSRKWATHYSAVLIVSGPVIEDDMERLGENKVGVPRMFYKVVCSMEDDKPRAIAFLVENREYKNRSMKQVAVTVDSVEKVTGIDFFPSFSNDVQKEMESSIDWGYWKFNRFN
ncbi:endonuclease G [Parabacteroides sp. PF5-5]|uniref:DNA/RNA non-specific endonuclease n=1 Tax=unclassified Parabacteroides TaxID=2649774 RepID=UPI00247409B2|nr:MULTISPECIES: DNA/RNA non-specific endonuclease [unclassified Parabacteroides]MDH6303974.1 endonuclease G [Parabacteroides sp. PH5-39]MDH6314590.1 endonuclease G [Parabacteroides sp. PF5-13]MDH6318345.1 endonuclease G [Parabacteroides sp. PH5-13]MDH6322363.1 endonuclease G [Parabacteroides sp. PH5-8]MDH6325558.1 endonuclease G [Parabacteroides sp. PH5-41]